jgi:hypothetical protein
MRILNRREDSSAPSRRRCHVLVEFPHPDLETVVVEWENQRPTLFIQLKRNAQEPLQFIGKRTDIEGQTAGAPTPKSDPAELSQQLRNFLNPSTAQPFTEFAWLADIVFSVRAFTLLQPEPDAVLPAQSLWECRAEALGALKLNDDPLGRVGA